MSNSLSDILRQRAWLLREAGDVETCDAVLQQLDLIPRTSSSKVS